jgi:hypothetical protein
MIGAGETAPPLALAGAPTETGRGAPVALGGQPFGLASPFSPGVLDSIEGDIPCKVVEIAARTPDGAPRPIDAVDAEVKGLAERALWAGRRVLLTLTDVSKTGLIFPSVACAMALKAAHPERVEVLVDACQFRLSPDTLRAYLRQGFLVAVTGSKFLGGPPFSGALFVPEAAADRYRRAAAPRGLSRYSARADWPADWAAGAALDPVANFGLLLRWSAAIETLRALTALPDAAVAGFLGRFGQTVAAALEQEPVLQPIPTVPIDRSALGQARRWDGLATIFPFALRRPGNGGSPAFASPAAAALVQQMLRWNLPVAGAPEASRPPHPDLSVELGQPVAFARVGGEPVAALRLNAGAPHVVEAVCGPQGAADRVLDQVQDALAKIAWVARRALV